MIGRRLVWIAVLLFPAAAAAADFIPLPEFRDYKVPETQHSGHRAAGWQYFDLVALAAGLGAASYFAVRRRSRRGLYLLAIVSLAWLGFWREGCVCPIGAIQNVTLAAATDYRIPWTVAAVFALPLVTTLFFGRTFCAAVCPLGAIQELAAVRPVRVPGWLDQALGLLGFVYLGLAVAFAASGTAFLICRYDPFVSFFRRSGSANMLIFGASLLAIGVFVARPYCRFLCPYGAILGLLSKVSRRHLRIPPGECIRCRLCEDVCPYNAIQAPTAVPPLEERLRGRWRLAAALAALPLLAAGGFIGGRWLEGPFARLDPAVRLAERIEMEDAGKVVGTIDASEAFRNSGREKADLLREAAGRMRTYGWAGAWFGGWVGLVIGVKLIHLSVRRRRDEFRPDVAKCVSCGRCFWYCPKEQERLGLIRTLDLPDPPRPADAPETAHA